MRCCTDLAHPHRDCIYYLLAHPHRDCILVINGVSFARLQNRNSLFLAYDVVAIGYTIGWRAVSFMIAQTAVISMVAHLTTSRLVVWIFAAAYLLMFQLESGSTWMVCIDIEICVECVTYLLL